MTARFRPAKSGASKSGLTPWRSKLDAIERANLESEKGRAQHHSSQLLRDIGETERDITDGMALLRGATPGARPKLRDTGHTPAGAAFTLCKLFPRRAEGAIMAITNVAGGRLPPDLERVGGYIRRTIEGIEREYQAYRKRSTRPDEEFALLRIRTYVERLKRYVSEFYDQAQKRYGLPPLYSTH